MLHISKGLSKGKFNDLVFKNVEEFAGLFSKRKPVKKDLDKYEVIVVGCNLGGIFSRHFDEAVHGKYKMMVVLD
jgi:hypothetical protein